MSHLGGHHLGGHWPGGDPSSWYPELWDWLVRVQGVHSVLDVGCGEGHALAYFRDQLDCEVVGVDGIEHPDPDLIQHDFTLGPVVLAHGFDLCWSCEFVEHVEEQFVPNFLEAFRSAELLAMTHALPGQGGHHHVNEQAPRYWRNVLAEVGFQLLPGLTFQARRLARDNAPRGSYFSRTGLIFRRDP